MLYKYSWLFIKCRDNKSILTFCKIINEIYYLLTCIALLQVKMRTELIPDSLSSRSERSVTVMQSPTERHVFDAIAQPQYKRILKIA